MNRLLIVVWGFIAGVAIGTIVLVEILARREERWWRG